MNIVNTAAGIEVREDAIYRKGRHSIEDVIDAESEGRVRQQIAPTPMRSFGYRCDRFLANDLFAFFS